MSTQAIPQHIAARAGVTIPNTLAEQLAAMQAAPQVQAAPAPVMQPDALIAQMQAMMAQIEALKAQLAQKNRVSYKVGPKGGLCVYGLQQRPYTFYLSQAERIIDEVKSGRFEAAIEQFRSQLTVKVQAEDGE